MRFSICVSVLENTVYKNYNFFEAQDNSEIPKQNGRSRQSNNKHSCCLSTEITNKKPECQRSPQLTDQVNYGTQMRERRESVQEYDWEQERMIRYRKIGNGENYLTTKRP